MENYQPIKQNNISGYGSIYGEWRNEFGSRMQIISIMKEGIISGIYQTNTGNPKPFFSEKFPLIGSVNESEIKFKVEFQKYDTVTTWQGKIEFKNQEMFIHSKYELIYSPRTTEVQHRDIFPLYGVNRFFKIA